jgi:uncharacterized protein YegL
MSNDNGYGRGSSGYATAGKACYLIYVVLDTSLSMRKPDPGARRADRDAPLPHFIRLIPQMLFALADDPYVNSVAAVGVLAFNDRPEVLRSMTTLQRPANIKEPRVGHGTDYAAVLRFMVDGHPSDVQAVRAERRRTDPAYEIRMARPWVFFITDGRPFAKGARQPEEEWLGYRDRLAGGAIQARVVTMGLPGAEEEVLWQLATGDEQGTRNAFITNRSMSAGELATSVIQAITKSITASTPTGILTIDPPYGMRRIIGGRP